MSKTSKTIIQASLRYSTKNKYSQYWNQFFSYCNNNKISLNNIKIQHVINFLSINFDNGNSYSHIKSLKSAIGHLVNFPPYTKLGDHPIMKKFMTGLFNLRPPKPKLGFVWDVKIVFDHFKILTENQFLPDNILTYKLVILLLLLGGQRVNTIFWFQVDEMIVTDISVTFAPSHVLKHSNKNRKLNIFEYRSYPHDKKLCIVDCLKQYLLRRKQKVSNDVKKLLITNKKPYKAVSIDTIRRWIKTTFNMVGIHNFSPHSCRSASTSKANKLNIDIDKIITKGCWKNVETFRKYYDKEIIEAQEEQFNELLQ